MEEQAYLLTQSLHSLSPMAVLNRGYAIVTREDTGRVVKHANQLKMDEAIRIRVSEGSLTARISKIDPGGS